MSVETVMRPSESMEDERRELSTDEASKIGETVFEKLAIDSRAAIEVPEGIEDTRLTMSLTRVGDGQTVPDDR